MNLYLRLVVLMFKMLFVKRKGVFEPSRVGFRVLPNDCDMNLHLNNGRYLTLMDLGRVHLIRQTGLLGALLKRRWLPVLAGAEISYMRPIKPLQKFELITRLVSWDNKYVYIEQRFEVQRRLHAIALLRGVFMCRGQRVDNQCLVNLLDPNLKPPPLPASVQHWNDLSDLKKRHHA